MSSNFEPETDARACRYPDYSSGERSVEDLPATGEGTTGIEARVWDALYAVEDPEMPISIVDLGLIYGVEMEERDAPEGHRGGEHGDAVERTANIDMTLTYTGCPARKMLQDDIEGAVAAVEGVEAVDLQLLFSPEWTIEMVTEQGKEDLREFGLSI